MSLFDLLFPPKCVLCRKVLEHYEEDVCSACRTDAPECPMSKAKLPFITGWCALWYYQDDIRKSILRYKFGIYRSYAHSYARLLAKKLKEEYPEGFDILTWVPISPIRKLKRGFDQVEKLAQALAEPMGMQPVRTLRKIRHNRPQSGISGPAHRRANVLGAYKVIDPQQLWGKRVLLLDDVITTGATAGECARMLLTAGAREVYVGAVAAVRHDSKIK
ncbi:MAG: ComF family protein [Oscillospiraceae bacterium]|nr:ComF family protein [Oscillospiraceae bacterium]